MKLLVYALAFLPQLLPAASEQLEIPQVEASVQSMLHNLSDYVNYKAPPGVQQQHMGPEKLVVQDASTPYWYENINHQGISPFGPGGYVVFRNVRDYGATGNGATDDTVRESMLEGIR